MMWVGHLLIRLVVVEQQYLPKPMQVVALEKIRRRVNVDELTIIAPLKIPSTQVVWNT